MNRSLIILLSLLALTLSACKKKGNQSKLQSEQIAPNKDYAPGSLDINECIESKAK